MNGFEIKKGFNDEVGETLDSVQTSILFLVHSVLTVEKLRVAAQVRLQFLQKKSIHDPYTEQIFQRLISLENELTSLFKGVIKKHPAYPWFSRVKGVGFENIAKVVGFIDINKANHISSLWKFAGYHVVDGKAPKRKKGKKHEFNFLLRTMCFRLGQSLLRAKSKFYEIYISEKKRLIERYKNQGYQIVPANQLPLEKGKRYEPEGIISEGHIHSMALRKMIKIFLACLWIVWREAEGLSVSMPWVIDHGGHKDFIDPWSLCD